MAIEGGTSASGYKILKAIPLRTFIKGVSEETQLVRRIEGCGRVSDCRVVRAIARTLAESRKYPDKHPRRNSGIRAGESGGSFRSSESILPKVKSIRRGDEGADGREDCPRDG
jgi:hypothetical protein